MDARQFVKVAMALPFILDIRRDYRSVTFSALNSRRHFTHLHLYEKAGHKKRPATVSITIRTELPAEWARRTLSAWHYGHWGLINRNDPFVPFTPVIVWRQARAYIVQS